MMDVFTVSLFGHREIDDLWRLEAHLSPILRELIQTKPYVTFLVGRHGEFDEYAASVIKRTQKAVGKENNNITLVLPYMLKDVKYYEEYYDSIIIPEVVYDAHPKAAITLKNQWMVSQSDLLIVYVSRKNGGAYTAMKYAEKQNKQVINLYSL